MKAGLTAGILPGAGSGSFDQGRGVGQRKEETNYATLVTRAGKSDREPALAEARDRSLFAFTVLKSEICGDIDRQPHGPSPFPFHERSRSSKTRLGFFGRNRFVDNKVRSRFERSL